MRRPTSPFARVLAALAAGLSQTDARPGPPSGAESVDIAEVVADPARFRGKTIAVRTCAMTDLHGTWLHACDDPHAPMLRLGIPAVGAPEYTAYDAAFGVAAGLRQPRLVATVGGTLERHPTPPHDVLRFRWIRDAAPYAGVVGSVP